MARQTFHLKTILNNVRSFGTTSRFLEVMLNGDNGVTTVTMRRPLLNAFNLEMLSEFSDVLTDLKRNQSRGMIFTSFSDKIFTAGFDLESLYKPNPDRLKQMLFLLEDINLKLYGSPFPTAAGHATGSGCLFCLCCDYRVMVKNFLIGLNELRLGITFPNWIINIMSNTIGVREAELALLAGRLFKTDEALKVGLVDEDASDRDVALKKANAFFEKLETTPSLARIHTTSILRNRVLEDMQRNMNIHVESALFEMLHPTVQTQIGLHLCNLKKKKD